MGFDKLEIMTSILERQIEKHDLTVKQMRQDMYEHSGAQQALSLIAKQFAGLSVTIEERIGSDLELGNAADKVLIYSKNIFARVVAMCDANSKAQTQQKFIAQGRMEAAQQSSDDITKEIFTQKAFLERRAELAKEAEEKAAAEAKEDVDKIVDKDTNPPKGNGVTKKKRAAVRKKPVKPRKRKRIPKKPAGDKEVSKSNKKNDTKPEERSN